MNKKQIYCQVAKLRFPGQDTFEKDGNFWVSTPNSFGVQIQNNEKLVHELVEEFKIKVNVIGNLWEAVCPGILTLGKTKEQAVYTCYVILERDKSRYI